VVGGAIHWAAYSEPLIWRAAYVRTAYVLSRLCTEPAYVLSPSWDLVYGAAYVHSRFMC
jgi:hypothetical protein